jgi:hypothetical protein
MEPVCEFLYDGWAEPRERGSYQTLLGFFVRSGAKLSDAVLFIDNWRRRILTGELPLEKKAFTRVIDGRTVYIWLNMPLTD